ALVEPEKIRVFYWYWSRDWKIHKSPLDARSLVFGTPDSIGRDNHNALWGSIKEGAHFDLSSDSVTRDNSFEHVELSSRVPPSRGGGHPAPAGGIEDARAHALRHPAGGRPSGCQ